MDATCAIQNSIHVFSLVHINMCPGFWVHINLAGTFDIIIRNMPGNYIILGYDTFGNFWLSGIGRRYYFS